MRADDGSAQNATVGESQHLDLAFGVPLRLGTVVFLKAPGEDIDVLVGLARLGFGQADMGKFRIGVGDSGQCRIIHLGRQAKQNVPDHDASVVAGDVGELRPTGHVADGEDAAVGGA
jgi:hypothetical protein